jgi:TfoX/Sxy family transcriptional regulator of competence genes
VVSVPYNAQLADRVRSALSDRDHVREVKMFGGLALMVDERMVVCVSGGGSDLLVRVAPERDAELVTKSGARRAEMGKNRSMGEGWITVDERALESDDDLQYWIDASLDFHARGSGQKTRKRGQK